MAAINSINSDKLYRLIGTPGAPLVIDVRTQAERAQHSIEGSVHQPLNGLRAATLGVPKKRPLVVFCAGGYRSSIAASLLQREGFTNVSELAGGMTAWESAGLPVSPGVPDTERPVVP